MPTNSPKSKRMEGVGRGLCSADKWLTNNNNNKKKAYIIFVSEAKQGKVKEMVGSLKNARVK